MDAEVGVEDRTEGVAALRVAGPERDHRRVAHDRRQRLELVRGGEAVQRPAVEHHGLRAAREQDPAELAEPVGELREVALRRDVVDRRPAGQRLADPRVGLRPDERADRHELAVAAHVLVVVLEPAGHVERLRDRRVPPGLQHPAAVGRRQRDVGDLEPVVGVELLVELGGQRRAHVERDVLPDRQPLADPAALEQEARGNGAGGDHDRLRADGQRPPVGQLGLHRAGVAVLGHDPLDRAVGDDPHALGAEVALRPRQHGVEHRELLAEAAADVAVAAADAAVDVGADRVDVELESRIAAALLDAAQELRRRRVEPDVGVVRPLVLAADGQPLLDALRAVPQLVELEPGGVLRVPALEHVPGRRDRDRVVDHRRAPDAAALEDREAEVLGLLEHAVAVEPADHLDLVGGELARLDVLPALEHDDVAAALGEAVGEHGAGRAAAHDAHVGPQVEALELLRARDRQRVHAGRGDPARAVQAAVALPLLERLVADRGEAAGIAVVADVGELVGDADHRLDEAAELIREPPAQDVAVEVGLEVVEPRRLVELGERRLEREQRVQLHRDQPGALHPLPLRADAPEVAVDVGGDVARRDGLLRALDDHVGERHQRPVLRRAEEARAQAGAHRRAPEQEQQRRDGAREPDPAEQPRERGDPGDVLVQIGDRQPGGRADHRGGEQRDREDADERQPVADAAGDVERERRRAGRAGRGVGGQQRLREQVLECERAHRGDGRERRRHGAEGEQHGPQARVRVGRPEVRRRRLRTSGRRGEHQPRGEPELDRGAHEHRRLRALPGDRVDDLRDCGDAEDQHDDQLQAGTAAGLTGRVEGGEREQHARPRGRADPRRLLERVGEHEREDQAEHRDDGRSGGHAEPHGASLFGCEGICQPGPPACQAGYAWSATPPRWTRRRTSGPAGARSSARR